jgi:hypothetical protein
MKLHQLTGAIANVEALLDADEIDATTAADTLAGLRLSFEERGLALARLIQNLEAEATAVEAHAKAAKERAAALKKKRDGVLEWLHQNMRATGVDRINAPDVRIAIKGKAPALILAGDFSTEDVPTRFLKRTETVTLDKVALKKAILDEGLEVPGVDVERDATRLEVKA